MIGLPNQGSSPHGNSVQPGTAMIRYRTVVTESLLIQVSNRDQPGPRGSHGRTGVLIAESSLFLGLSSPP
eukprot:288674-Hanusia_phi.AAC.1